MISAIVAVNEDWGIGFNGDLLEHIPEDLKYFKQLTSGYTVVMGTNTWNSLPKKPLANRSNIIISSTQRSIMCQNTLRLHMEDVIDYFKYTKDEVFIIGGGSIYKQLLPYCNKVYVTKINKSHKNVDTYFPNLDKLDDWTLGASSELYIHKDFTYQFCEYNRI